MNPNHYLAVAIWYLFQHRPGWRADAAVGKTLVSSSMIDRVAAQLGRRLAEVPVGFKWFVDGLLDGSFGFGGEESAGASFLRTDGTVWTTDKDGILLALLAAEITACTGRDPAEHYRDLEELFGSPVYERMDAPASPAQKAVLSALSPDLVAATELAGEPIVAKLTRAPSNEAPIGGLKVVTANGWFAARPSGTENIYKIYAESFKGQDHLQQNPGGGTGDRDRGVSGSRGVGAPRHGSCGTGSREHAATATYGSFAEPEHRVGGWSACATRHRRWPPWRYRSAHQGFWRSHDRSAGASKQTGRAGTGAQQREPTRSGAAAERLAAHLCRPPAPELSAVVSGATGVAGRHLDADHRPELSSL